MNAVSSWYNQIRVSIIPMLGRQVHLGTEGAKQFLSYTPYPVIYIRQYSQRLLSSMAVCLGKS